MQQQLKKQKTIQQKTPENEEEDLWSDIRNLRLIRHHLSGHQSQFLLPSSTMVQPSQQHPNSGLHNFVMTRLQSKTKQNIWQTVLPHAEARKRLLYNASGDAAAASSSPSAKLKATRTSSGREYTKQAQHYSTVKTTASKEFIARVLHEVSSSRSVVPPAWKKESTTRITKGNSYSKKEEEEEEEEEETTETEKGNKMPKEVSESILHKNKTQTTLQNSRVQQHILLTPTFSYSSASVITKLETIIKKVRENDLENETKPAWHDAETEPESTQKKKKKKPKQDWQAKSAKKETCRGGEAWRTFCPPPPSPLPWTWRHFSIFPLLLLLLLQHFSLRTPLARNDRNPKTFQKERHRERERERRRGREIHRSLAARLTTPSLQPSLVPILKHIQRFLPNRNLIRSLIPSLSHLSPKPESEPASVP